MSEAEEIANKAGEEIDQLLLELIEGNHKNNEILLGSLLLGKEEIQVQLKITKDQSEFFD